jgi:formate hydrogenlyase transcriptional activator
MDGLRETSEGQLRGQGVRPSHTEAAVAARPCFDALLSELSTKFLNLSLTALDREITQGLQRLAECLEVEQSSLFELSEGATRVRTTHLWIDPGCGASAAPVMWDHVPLAFAALRRGEMVRFSPSRDSSDEPTGTHEDLLRCGLQSAIAIPLSVAGSLTGVIALATLRTKYAWPQRVVQQGRLVGEIFANALSRNQTHVLLQAAAFEHPMSRSPLYGDHCSPHRAVNRADHVAGMIGTSAVLNAVRFRVNQVAPSDTPVLLLGETGVGKELMARALYQQSRRSARPFVTVNCAALSASLIESELFGHEKGAFTGAAARRGGRFEAAHGGTLFLDEIGDLPVELQAKLLRVLEQGEFERVGSSHTIRINVRIIAATNRDLEADMRGGRFRPDLYYRLAVFPITVPALRERLDDIPLLVRAFVAQYAQRAGKAIPTVPVRVMDTLQAYAWPGNVRELRNVIERAVINTQGPSLCLLDQLPGSNKPRVEYLGVQPLAVAEAAHIRRVLESTQWKIEGHAGAAAALGLPASTLRKRMRKLSIQRPTSSEGTGRALVSPAPGRG